MKQEGKWIKYRLFLYIALVGSTIGCLAACYFSYWEKIPRTIKIRAGMEEQMDFAVPASGFLQSSDKSGEEILPVSLNHPVTFYANQVDSYKMDVKLFGIVPLKSVDVQVIQDKTLIPAGIPIGIYVKTDGVLVIGTGEFTGYDGNRHAPTEHLLKSGDYITGINHEPVTGKKMFMRRLQEIGDGEVVLTIRRNGESFDVRTTSLKDQAGTNKIGIWIRDNAQGVGTLTYIDENGGFGALGHGINDMDTSTLMSLATGTLYHTDIVGVKKGIKGEPGELTGIIDYTRENIIGDISQNSDQGIFGICGEKLTESVGTMPVPIGLKHEVRKGPAQILCSIGSSGSRYYNVEIMEVNYESEGNNRGLVLRITDPKLLEETGGIVQGMSGAPILQNGKIIGAVTHVFVQDSTKGYGIFIEEMLEHEYRMS